MRKLPGGFALGPEMRKEFKKMMKLISILTLLFVAAIGCGAESLQVTATPASTQVKRGEPVVMAVNLKNVLTPREPITLTAEAQWEDEYGRPRPQRQARPST